MRKIEIIDELKAFPIGGNPETSLDVLSKAEVVSYLARFQDEFNFIENPDDREKVVRQFYSKLLENDLPNIVEAARNLKVSLDFLNDYNKIQMVKETNGNYNKAYQTLTEMLELDQNKKNSL